MILFLPIPLLSDRKEVRRPDRTPVERKGNAVFRRGFGKGDVKYA